MAMNVGGGEIVGVVMVVSMMGCILLSIKTVMENGTKRKIIEAHVSEELARTLLQSEVKIRNTSSLKWGLVLTALGLAFSMIDIFKIEIEGPLSLGLLAAFSGIGLLCHHFLSQRQEK